MTWLGQNAPAFHGEMRWAAWNDEKHSFRRDGSDPDGRRRDLASQCVLGVGAECRFSDGAGVDRHGCYFWASRESLPFSIAIFSGGLDVLGDNDLFVLMC